MTAGAPAPPARARAHPTRSARAHPTRSASSVAERNSIALTAFSQQGFPSEGRAAAPLDRPSVGGPEMDNKDVISTLNDLIETSKDGENGFRACADGVKGTQLK